MDEGQRRHGDGGQYCSDERDESDEEGGQGDEESAGDARGEKQEEAVDGVEEGEGDHPAQVLVEVLQDALGVALELFPVGVADQTVQRLLGRVVGGDEVDRQDGDEEAGGEGVQHRKSQPEETAADAGPSLRVLRLVCDPAERLAEDTVARGVRTVEPALLSAASRSRAGRPC